MKDAKRWFLGAWCIGLVVACGGIAQPLGETDDPVGAAGSSMTSTGGSGGGSGGGNGSNLGGPAHPCETACLQEIFSAHVASCKLCHTDQPSPYGLQSSGLDLQSPGVTARLKDIPAKHGDLAIGMSAADCPTGDKLLDTANPENSWLLKKIRGMQGACGTSMPQPPTLLKPAEQQCVQTYVYCVAGQ
jgi:hypothetical protein